LLRSRNVSAVLKLAASRIKKPNLEHGTRPRCFRLLQFCVIIGCGRANGCENSRHAWSYGDSQHHKCRSDIITAIFFNTIILHTTHDGNLAYARRFH
jgi:hypothetical protein